MAGAVVTPGFAKPRAELPWLPYGETDRVIINSHNFTPPLWTPASISASLWVDASDVSTVFDADSGGSVITNNGYAGRIVDKSTNAWALTQATATTAARPQWKASQQNGLGALSFSHSRNAFLRSASYNGESSKTSFVRCWAAKLNTIEVNLLLCASDAGGSHFQVYLNQAYTYWQPGSSVVGGVVSTSIGTAWRVITSVFDASRTAANRLKLYIDGTELLSGQAGNNGGATPSTQGFYLGYNSSVSWSGLIGEGVVAGDVTEQQRLEGYLAWRWGIQANLPVGHTYKSVAP